MDNHWLLAEIFKRLTRDLETHSKASGAVFQLVDPQRMSKSELVLLGINKEIVDQVDGALIVTIEVGGDGPPLWVFVSSMFQKFGNSDTYATESDQWHISEFVPQLIDDVQNKVLESFAEAWPTCPLHTDCMNLYPLLDDVFWVCAKGKIAVQVGSLPEIVV